MSEIITTHESKKEVAEEIKKQVLVVNKLLTIANEIGLSVKIVQNTSFNGKDNSLLSAFIYEQTTY